MKKATHEVHWLKACNGFLSGAMTLLGYDPSGSQGRVSLEYGCPYVRFEVKGKVVDKKKKRPLEGIQVSVWPIIREEPSQRYAPLYTDKEGVYSLQQEDMPFDSIQVMCEDPSGVYQTSSATVRLELKGGAGRCVGVDSRVVNFELSKSVKHFSLSDFLKKVIVCIKKR